MRSLVLQIPDDVYEEARQAAAARGFGDMTAYVVDLIAHDTADADDALLSPESLEAIDRAREEFREGKGLTLDQVRGNLAEGRSEWLRANAR